MFEQYTFDDLLAAMLDRIPANLDKREGSLIYNALAPAAAELAQLYMNLSVNMNLSYADTASGVYLSRRTAEHGVERYPATKALRRGLFYTNEGSPATVPLGSRYFLDSLHYRVVERLRAGEYVLECETAGAIGNANFGELLPVDYVEGLARAELTDVMTPGQDEESDEALRIRFYEKINEQPFGGNVGDYKQKISVIPGLGGVKIFPVWAGGGTVKCTVIASDFRSPSSELVEEVQMLIDPEVNQGEGLGIAPIGHTVTVRGVEEVEIEIETELTLDGGTSPGQVEAPIQEVLEDYFLQQRQTWSSEEQLVIRAAQIDARILTIPGIIDVDGTLINGSAENLTLGAEQIPRLGQVTINE